MMMKVPRKLIAITCIHFLVLTSILETTNCSKDQQLTELTPPNDPTNFLEENSINELLNGRSTFDEYLVYAMKSLKLITGFDNDLHRYDSKADLVNSFARNLSYTDDIGHLVAHVDQSELDLLKDEPELTVIENELTQTRCKSHLESILEETTHLYANWSSFSRSKQLSLINYLDSFGAPSSQLMEGNVMWLGSYKQCSESRLNFQGKGERTAHGNRYCVANYRSPFWPGNENKHDDDDDSYSHQHRLRLGSESIKLGVCLPESCNSISILRHRERIDAIVKLTKLNQIPYSAYKLTHLYCLPDNSSPLRQFSWSARIFILTLASWLTVVAYFSIKYELIRMKYLDGDAQSRLILSAAEASNSMNIFAFRLSWSKLFQDSNLKSSVPPKVNNGISTSQTPSSSSSSKCESSDGRESGIESSDSESTSSASSGSGNNNDFEPSRSYSPAALEEHDERLQQKSRQNLKLSNMLEAVQNPIFEQKPTPIGRNLEVKEDNNSKTVEGKDRLRRKLSAVVNVNNSEVKKSTDCSKPAAKIDLSVIDGLKVLSMIWLIGAHTLLFFIRSISNPRDFWSILKDARFMSIMSGIFPVDSFFTITGILTAYLKFSKNDGQAMGGVHHWIEALVHRYLRFMPMYLIVFWYTRDISEYIGDGPLWDYATTDTSLRSTCKQESFSVPLLFQANFKPLDKHCIKPAWYLANDYQYLLITPIYMGLLMKSTLLGYSFIGLSVVLSLVLQFSTVFFSSDIEDFQTLINFKPMFGAYILKNLWKLYVLPYNRIPPYLLGILTGHMMYSLNKKSTSKCKVANHVTFQSQDSLASLSNNNNLNESSSDILKVPKQQHSIGFIGTLSNYICIKVWIPLMFLISIIYLPMVTRVSTQEGLSAKIGTSSIIAIMRLVWSLAIAGLIYVCSTRSVGGNDDCNNFIIRFLSLKIWKPWSKIGLSALLIQWEVISYLSQTQIGLPNMTISFIAAIILLSIFLTYSIALITYLTLEYPLSQVERLYINPIFNNK